MFCFDLELRNNFTDLAFPAVYAEITSVVPDIGHNGYPFPLGTSADPSTVAVDCEDGEKTPSGTLGLWDYGAMGPGGVDTQQWVFEYTPEPFTFRGRIVALYGEFCIDPDGNADFADNDCDGYANEGCSGGDCCYRRVRLADSSYIYEPCGDNGSFGCPTGETCAPTVCSGDAGEYDGQCIAESMAQEVCGDGIDNDCDGTVDDGCPGGGCCLYLGSDPSGLIGEPACADVAPCPGLERCVAISCSSVSIIQNPGVCVADGVPDPPCE